MNTARTCWLVVIVLMAGLAAPATAEVEPPSLPTYTFCGWQDFTNGGWRMTWSEDLAGAYVVGFARNMQCAHARRNIARIKYSRTGRPLRPGYRCQTLKSAHEFSDVRCVKRGSRATFRYQTGA